MISTRNYSIDALKAFGIVCIVIAHNDYTLLGNYLYSFHIPLFFLVSGIFFEKKNSFIILFKKRFVSLMVPYFSMATLLYLFWWAVGRKFGESATMELSAVKNFIGIFYAQGGHRFMNWGIPLWFLPCLFLVTLAYHFIASFKKTILIPILIVSAGVAYIMSRYLPFHLPWSLDIVFAAIVFFGIGNMSRNFVFRIIDKNYNHVYRIGLMLTALILNVLFFILNDTIDISKAIYHNLGYTIVSGVAGTLFFLLLFCYLPYYKMVAYIGKNTLLIMGFHLRAMTIIKAIQLFIFHTTLEMTTPLSIVYAVVQIAMLVPLIWLINRYLPFIAGKSIGFKNT